MKTFYDLVNALNSGKTFIVTFTPRIEDAESYPEGQMRARLTKGSNCHDQTVVLTFDYSEFDAHNLALEKSNYYDEYGRPTLTARQANFYKPIEEIYFMGSDLVEEWMKIEDSTMNDLWEQYRADVVYPSTSYVQWLEQQVRKMRGA